MFHLYRLILIVYFIKSIETETFIPFKSVGYYIGGQVESYSEAESQCEKENATLAIVNNKDIRVFLVNNLAANITFPYSYYIGLRRITLDNNDDAFEWIDGTSLSGGYEDWDGGSPNNRDGNELCVIMGWLYELDADFKWIDVSCSIRSRFICQKPIVKDMISMISTPTTQNTLTPSSARKNTPSALSTEWASFEAGVTAPDSFPSYPNNETKYTTFVSTQVCSMPASVYLLSVILGVVIFCSCMVVMVLLRQVTMLRNKVKALDFEGTLHPPGTVHKPSPEQDSSYLQPIPMTEPHNYEKINDLTKKQRSYANLAVETKESNAYDL